MILVDISGARAAVRKQDVLTCGMVGAQVRFRFDEAWDSLAKTAVFRAGKVTKDAVLTGTQVRIPHEVLSVPGLPLEIGVYGTDAGGTLAVPTLWAKTQPIQPGADPSGDPGADPTLPVWAQLTAQTERMDTQLQGIRDGADGMQYNSADEGVRTQFAHMQANVDAISDTYSNIGYCNGVKDLINVPQAVPSSNTVYHGGFNGYTFDKEKVYLVFYELSFSGYFNSDIDEGVRPYLYGYDNGFISSSYVGEVSDNKFFDCKNVVLGEKLITYSVVKTNATSDKYKVALVSLHLKDFVDKNTTKLTYHNVVVAEVADLESGKALAEKLIANGEAYRKKYNFPKVTAEALERLEEKIDTAGFDANSDVLVLPDTVFTTDKELLSRVNALTNKDVEIRVQYSTGAPEYGIRNYRFDELDWSRIPNGTTVNVFVKTGEAVSYAKPILVKKAASVTDNPLKILCIGDSITNRNFGNMLRSYMKTVYGLSSVTCVGTMTNQFNAQGEGREGWKFTNFIGKSWATVSGTAIAPLTEQASGSLSANPFVRIATAGDDASKVYEYNGTGYIFDFANYLAVQGIEAPDVITIALSTNDILSGNEDYIADCENALQIMVESIREALPNVKIGVIPTFGFAMTEYGNNLYRKAFVWVKRCMELVAGFGDSGICVVPTYMFVDRIGGYPVTSAAVESNVCNLNRVTVTDTVHTSVINAHADAASRWVCNVMG